MDLIDNMHELESMLTIINIEDGIQSECSVYNECFGDNSTFVEMCDNFGGHEIIKEY